MTYLTISIEVVSVHPTLRGGWQQLGSETEGGDAIACWCGECDRVTNFDAPLVADGLLSESYHRSPGRQLL
jgi:hypothetical protein